ncbi:MAG: 1,2-phenylacetyl-CoA epoxidase subunit PaaE [Actinomycetota bacterium]
MTAPARTVAPRHAVFHRLRVAAVDRLTDDAVAVTFDVPSALVEEYRFVQGQHVAVRLAAEPGDVRRNYSICSSVASGRLRIGIRHIPGGVFSSYALTRLRPGDELEVMTPVGRFHTPLDPGQARRYAAVVAGSGITPVLSILATTLETEPASAFTLLYGNRSTASVMFLDELADLKDRFPTRLVVHHVLSREPREPELFHGRLDGPRLARFLDLLLPPGGVDEWFLCGPLPMVEQARATLRAFGVDPRHVHAELFHVGPAPAPPAPRAAEPAAGRAATVTVRLDGRSSTFPLPRDGESVLEAALRVRPDAPYACKGGVCGTCRARLVEGRVRMDRNYALEEAEREAGFVLACQSHPDSDTVVLDFDA